MDKDTVIALALQAGADMYSSDRIEFWVPRLERFAALVAAAEREECAKVADEHAAYWAGYKIAAAIRSRK